MIFQMRWGQSHSLCGTGPPIEGVDTHASTETSAVPHVHKKLMLGSHIDTEIGMARPSTNGRCGTGHVEDQVECRRGEENVTKSVESFEDKAVDKDGYRTPSNPPSGQGDSRGTESSPCTCKANGGKLGGDPELSGRTQERVRHEPHILNLEIAIAQLYEGKNTDGPFAV